eukprot:scaffold10848_cov57-Phaeocystis_antarctica.AAC.3
MRQEHAATRPAKLSTRGRMAEKLWEVDSEFQLEIAAERGRAWHKPGCHLLLRRCSRPVRIRSSKQCCRLARQKDFR